MSRGFTFYVRTLSISSQPMFLLKKRIKPIFLATSSIKSLYLIPSVVKILALGRVWSVIKNYKNGHKFIVMIFNKYLAITYSSINTSWRYGHLRSSLTSITDEDIRYNKSPSRTCETKEGNLDVQLCIKKYD